MLRRFIEAKVHVLVVEAYMWGYAPQLHDRALGRLEGQQVQCARANAKAQHAAIRRPLATSAAVSPTLSNQKAQIGKLRAHRSVLMRHTDTHNSSAV